jgi:hypothetical protein
MTRMVLLDIEEGKSTRMLMGHSILICVAIVFQITLGVGGGYGVDNSICLSA